MNAFDISILQFLNSFARRSELLDHGMWFMSNNVFVVGAVPMALFWYAWIRYGTADSEKRQFLALGIFESVFALSLARLLALSLPFRLRPFHNAALHFHLPFAVDPTSLIGWSSFPSDRATLFACVAAVLWLVSRRVGILAMSYTLLGLCLPAIYCGIHYPTDIIAGIVLGSGIAVLGGTSRVTHRLAPPLLRYLETRPALFHAILFLWTFEIAELFGSVRSVVVYVLRHARLMG